MGWEMWKQGVRGMEELVLYIIHLLRNRGWLTSDQNFRYVIDALSSVKLIVLSISCSSGQVQCDAAKDPCPCPHWPHQLPPSSSPGSCGSQRGAFEGCGEDCYMGGREDLHIWWQLGAWSVAWGRLPPIGAHCWCLASRTHWAWAQNSITYLMCFLWRSLWPVVFRFNSLDVVDGTHTINVASLNLFQYFVQVLKLSAQLYTLTWKWNIFSHFSYSV